MDIKLAYSLCISLASVGVLIASLELLTLRSEFRNGGLFDWGVLKTASRFALIVDRGKYSRPISHSAFVPAVAGGRAFAALMLMFFYKSSSISTACVMAVVAASIALYWRSPLGLDGSDQMSTIVLVAVGIHKMFRYDVQVAEASLWFIAVQGCLAYFVAGVAKLVSPVWRNGEAVRRIFSTRTYGSQTAADLVGDRRSVCVTLSWLVIAFECSFPLALLFGTPGFVVFAVLGFAFHITNAVVMGLNTFVWAFLACYPAILFCAASIRQ